NRHGTPSPGAPDPDWMTPKPDDPATQLVSAACDPAYAWPLRTASAATAAPAKAAETPSEPATPAAKPLQATQTQPTPAAKPPAPAMVETRPAAFFVQIARGPSEDGARRALQKARKSLGPLADGLTD